MNSVAIEYQNSREQEFLDWFSQQFNGQGIESKFTFENLFRYCVSFSEDFQGKSLGGHGYGSHPSVAALKGAAELTERKVVTAYYRQNPNELFKNSNGWAVQFSKNEAKAAALREALERHILLYTYLRSGWNEFVLLDHKVSQKGEAFFLVSPYTCNGHFAGLVVYQDHRFPGISFGHMADALEKVNSSPRWAHALFEAVAFVERGLETDGFEVSLENQIYEDCRLWLLEPWTKRTWKKDLNFQSMPEAKIEILSGSVSSLFPSFEGLVYSHVKSNDLIPLFVAEDLKDASCRGFLEQILAKYELALPSGRHPIL